MGPIVGVSWLVDGGYPQRTAKSGGTQGATWLATKRPYGNAGRLRPLGAP